MAEFIRECIIIISREKENGTLTDEAGKEIIEFLDMTCSYLLKNEPELKKEVRRIMSPIVMTQMERAEYEIKLINKRLEEEKKEKNMHSERNENAIRKLVKKYCASGQERQEVKESIQDIFSLDETEAKEKMEKYWMQEDE